MKTYQFDPEKLKKQTKMLVLMYSIPLVLMMILIYFLNRKNPNFSITQTLILVALMIGFYVFMGLRRYKQNVQLWNDYTLKVDEDGVSQTQPNFPEVRIPKEEIVGIEVVKNGFYVKTKSQGRVLGISKELKDEEYDELKQIFSAWAAENEANLPADDEDDVVTPELTIADKAEQAIDTIDTKLADAESKVEDVVQGVETKVKETVETVKDKAHDAKDKAEDVFEEAKEKAEEIIETVKDKAHDAKDNIEDTVSEKIEDIKDALHTDGDNK